jgi:hypothetical protein
VIGRPALVFAVVAVFATGVDGHRVAAGTGDAATVNGVSITVEEFDELVTALADAGLNQLVPSSTSRTIGGDTGRDVLRILVTNEASRQFFADAGAEPVTAADIEEVFAGVPPDQPVQALEGDARATVGEQQVYLDRLDAIEPDVSTMGEQYGESPASLGVYCAKAISVADTDQADAVIAAVEDGAAPDDAGGESVADWQCATLASVADPELLAELIAAGPGDALGPARTGDELVVLVIDTFDTAAPKLENFFLRLEEEGSGTSAGDVLFQGFLFGSDISANPRYGRWDPVTGTIVALGA